MFPPDHSPIDLIPSPSMCTLPAIMAILEPFHAVTTHITSVDLSPCNIIRWRLRKDVVQRVLPSQAWFLTE